MHKKKVFIITEGGKRIGLGHLMRCIAVAERIKDAGRMPFFFVNKDKAAAHTLIRYGFDFKSASDIGKGFNAELHSLKGHSVLIDSKKDLSPLLRRLEANGCRITLLHNLANTPKFFPLRKEFLNIKQKRKEDYILISMGGTDLHNLTRLVLDAVSGVLGDIKIVAAIGKAFCQKPWLRYQRGKSKKNIAFIVDPKNFPGLLGNAALVITALGITIYEAAYLRRPILVINNYKSDLEESKKLEKLGFCKSLGFYQNVGRGDIVDALKELLFSKKSALRPKISMLPDDNGARRISGLLLK